VVLTVGVVAADVATDEELHAVAGVVRLGAWDGAQAAAGVGRQLVLIVGVKAADVAAADVELDVAVAGVVQFLAWDGAQGAACVRRAAGACRRSDGRGRCGERAAGLGGGSGAVGRVGRCASCRSRGARSWCLSLK